MPPALPVDIYSADKGSFGSITLCQKQFIGDAMIQVEAKVQFCLFRICSVFGPVHGKYGIDQPIYGNKITELGMLGRQGSCCLFL